ncbi:MAG: hypothetical protein KatS3mg114_0551 [Planctomycetaceae bacterium]|nr:MAG: hypothetical protein KatS3mg114_0551 [Planctomycetaceae bacterium]
MRVRQALCASLLWCAGLMMMGCSSSEDKWKSNRPKTVPASGKITLNNEPLVDAQVVLVPVSGSYGASGLSGKDGSFKLSAFPPDEGVVPGSYKVMIVKAEVPEVQEDEAVMSYAKLLVPQKYTDANTSGLTVDIPESGKTDIKLDLTGEVGK